MRKECSRLVFALACITGILLLAPGDAAAWDFSDTCAPRTEHPTVASVPNVFTILDRSGSMDTPSGYDIDGDGYDEDRWEASRAVIYDVANSVYRAGTCNPPSETSGCDKIHFGIGYFDDTGETGVAPGEDTRDAIETNLLGMGTGGNTFTGLAADLIVDSSELDDPTRPSIGIIITDGIAEDEETMQHAVERLCEGRDRPTSPIQTWAVGFSGDADQQLNSLLAAAGGTGYCCYGGDDECDAADRFDPCSIPTSELDDIIRDYASDNSTYIASGHTCAGSKEASDPEELKTELLTIAGAAACTFQLDVPAGYPTTGALEDPEATDVTVNHAMYGSIRLPYANPEEDDPDTDLDDILDALGVSDTDDFEDDGFFFTSPQRTHVQLTDDICAAVQTNDIQTVETQVACPCENGGDPCTVSGAEGRCAEGVISCDTGTEECLSKYRAMPEICNGLDDDCDGKIDDLYENETEWDDSDWELPADHTGLYCGQRDVCVCPGGITDAFGSETVNLLNGSTESEEFDAYLDTWTGACKCGVGLSSDESSAAYTPAPASSEGGTNSAPPQPSYDGAACKIARDGEPFDRAGWMLFFGVITLLGLARRREQR